MDNITCPSCGLGQPTRFVGPTEVAMRLGVTERTVGRWLRSGLLPSLTIGRSRRVREQDLRDFIAERAAA